MSKKINYYVIGGQHAWYCDGGTPTLLGAKRLARKNEEYWDNWQGWHTPSIYAAEDCEKGRNWYGTQMMPKAGAFPVAVYDYEDQRWHEPARW